MNLLCKYPSAITPQELSAMVNDYAFFIELLGKDKLNKAPERVKERLEDFRLLQMQTYQHVVDVYAAPSPSPSPARGEGK